MDPVPKPNLDVGAPVTADSGGTVAVYTTQQIWPCTEARYSDITAVIAAPKPTVDSGDHADDHRLDNPNNTTSTPPSSTWMTHSGLNVFCQETILQFHTSL